MKKQFVKFWNDLPFPGKLWFCTGSMIATSIFITAVASLMRLFQ